MERLQKILARSGVASRRGAEGIISAGRVKINGKTVKEMGILVDPQKDQVFLDNRPLAEPPATTYLIYKPQGVVCSRRRQEKEQIITDLLPAWPSVYPVGRLDRESEGLLLVSNEGELTYALTHPSFEKEKVYFVEAKWKSTQQPLGITQLEERLLKGVKLGDGQAKADRLEILSHNPEKIIFRLTVHEGRHHLLRRMLATLGLKVTRLIRQQIGSLSLGNLKPGKYRLLTTNEKSTLQ